MRDLKNRCLKNMLFGVCRVSCDGKNCIRLINICSHRGITAWSADDESCFCIRPDDTELLTELADKYGIKVDIQKSRSMADALRKNKKRLSILVGLALFVFLVYMESLYIWHIDVEGAESYTEDEILDVIALEYPCYGTKKSDIDLGNLRNVLMDSFDEVCWVSCGISGTRLTVNIKESVDVFIADDMSEPCNIVAAADCTIYSIVTAAGTPVAAGGDDVKKGDILISGAVSIRNDDNEVVDTRYVTAAGEVYGVTKLKYYDELAAGHYLKDKKEEKTSEIKLCIGNMILTPYKRKLQGTNIDYVSETYYAHAADYYLPVSLTVTKANTYDVHTEIYSESELRNIANEHLQTYIAKLREKGVQILKKNVIISGGSEGFTASGELTVRLPVGVPAEISPADMAQQEISDGSKQE